MVKLKRENRQFTNEIKNYERNEIFLCKRIKEFYN